MLELWAHLLFQCQRGLWVLLLMFQPLFSGLWFCCPFPVRSQGRWMSDNELLSHLPLLRGLLGSSNCSAVAVGGAACQDSCSFHRPIAHSGPVLPRFCCAAQALPSHYTEMSGLIARARGSASPCAQHHLLCWQWELCCSPGTASWELCSCSRSGADTRGGCTKREKGWFVMS